MGKWRSSAGAVQVMCARGTDLGKEGAPDRLNLDLGGGEEGVDLVGGDVESLIGEDEGGVGGRELVGRHGVEKGLFGKRSVRRGRRSEGSATYEEAADQIKPCERRTCRPFPLVSVSLSGDGSEDGIQASRKLVLRLARET